MVRESTGFRLDAGLVARLRVVVAMEGERLSALVERAIEREIARMERQRGEAYPRPEGVENG